MRPALRNLLLSDTVKATLDYQFSKTKSLTGVGPPLTFACSSNRTYFNSAGTLSTSEHNLLTYSNAFSNAAWTKTRSAVLSNLVLQSQAFDNAAWTKTDITVTQNDTTAPDGTLTADLMTEGSAGTARTTPTSAVTINAGAVLTGSGYLKRSSVVQWMRVRVVDSTGTDGVDAYFDVLNGVKGSAVIVAGGLSVSNTMSAVDAFGFYRVTVTVTMPVGRTTALLQVSSAAANNNSTRVSGSAYWLWGAQLVNSATAETYTATTSAAVPIPFAGPGNGGPSVAYKLVEDATATSIHFMAQTATMFSDVWSGELYVKAAERSWVKLQFGTTNDLCWFNSSTGATGTKTDGATATAESRGSGWYRVTATPAYNATVATSLSVTIGSADNTATYSGDGVSGIYIAGAQLEQSPTATSYKDTTSAAYYAPVFDHNPTTLRSLGLSLWEARTNSIRNNTMQGAVAGVARTIGTAVTASRTASATVVIASVGHNVAVNDMITVSGANVAEYNGTFIVSAVTANVSYSYVSASSQTDSATGYTVAVVSPGTLPTNWATAAIGNGFARTVVGTGVESGISYVDIRVAGLAASGSSQNFVISESTTQIAAAQNDLWTNSAYLKLVGGGTSNISVLSISAQGRDIGGSLLEQTLASILAVSSAALNTQRYVATDTLTNASTAYTTPAITFTPTISTMIDITLRIGMPQLELGAFATPVIATYGAAATRWPPSCSTTDLSWYNPNEGTFVAEYMVPTISVNQRVFTLRDASSAESVFGMFTNSGGSGNYFGVKVGGSETATVPGSHSPVGGTFYKLVGAYQENNTNGARNGTLGTNDVACAMPTGITALQIGATVNSQFINGYLQSLTYYPKRLPDATLQRLST